MNEEYIEYLKSLAKANPDQKCTMCLHNDVRAHVHEMINVYPRGIYIRPHSHPFKTETKIIIVGKLLVIIYDDVGRIKDEFVMKEKGVFTFRLDRGIIHTNIPLTDVVFHEVISGPFVGKDDSIFPRWAPEASDAESVAAYMKELEKQVGYSITS